MNLKMNPVTAKSAITAISLRAIYDFAITCLFIAGLSYGISPFARASSGNEVESSTRSSDEIIKQVLPIVCVPVNEGTTRGFSLDANLIGTKQKKNLGLSENTISLLKTESVINLRLECGEKSETCSNEWKSLDDKSYWLSGASLDPLTRKVADVVVLKLVNDSKVNDQFKKSKKVRLTISRDDAIPIVSTIQFEGITYFSHCFWKSE